MSLPTRGPLSTAARRAPLHLKSPAPKYACIDRRALVAAAVEAQGPGRGCRAMGRELCTAASCGSNARSARVLSWPDQIRIPAGRLAAARSKRQRSRMWRRAGEARALRDCLTRKATGKEPTITPCWAKVTDPFLRRRVTYTSRHRGPFPCPNGGRREAHVPRQPIDLDTETRN